MRVKIEAHTGNPGDRPKNGLPVLKDGIQDGVTTYDTTIEGNTAFMVKGYDGKGQVHGAEVRVDGTKSAVDNIPLIFAQLGSQGHNQFTTTFPTAVRLATAEVETNGTLLVRFTIGADVTGMRVVDHIEAPVTPPIVAEPVIEAVEVPAASLEPVAAPAPARRSSRTLWYALGLLLVGVAIGRGDRRD